LYGEPRPYRVSLSDVRVIIAINRVLVELLYQVVKGWVLALECLLSGVRAVTSCPI
jgi:hypothetical protein